MHEDALGVAVPIQVAGVRDGRPTAVAALAASVPVGTEARTVVGVLTTAARGIGRTLGNGAAKPCQ